MPNRKVNTPSRRKRAAMFVGTLCLSTGLLVGVDATAAMAEPSGFCGALVQGHDAWYHNCGSRTVRRAADKVFAFDDCRSIAPGATTHWRDPVANIRRVYAC